MVPIKRRGGTLTDFFNRNPSKIEIIDVLIQVLHGLSYLHKNDIIHRDIKPSNILVEENPLRAYISDFGSVFSKRHKITIGSIIGSPSFSSPEQFLSSYNITAASDLWSFGVTIFWLLTGNFPYSIEDQSREFLNIGNLNEFEEPFREILKKCLVKDANNRVQSADELITILLNYQGGATKELEKRVDEISSVFHKLVELEELTKNLQEDITWLRSLQQKIISVLPSKKDKIKILFLGANPTLTPLKLAEEIKKISFNLKLAKDRDNLNLAQEWAVTVESLIQAVLDESPNFIHFSGHGNQDGIIIQDNFGKPHQIPSGVLDDLFEILKDTVVCVVLNSCYSREQAMVIHKHIPFVVGMKNAIPDETAIAFASGFYRGIGAKKSIPQSFKIGVIEAKAKGLSGSDNPILLRSK